MFNCISELFKSKPEEYNFNMNRYDHDKSKK